jgi:hypothetical protein
MAKKILYLSCHEILEYDELRLFSELGYECYSLGAYTQPGGEEHRKRPPLELPYDPHFIELSLQYDRRRLHPEMLEGFDIVIVMHTPSYLGHVSNHDWHPDLAEGNWPLFRDFIKKGGRVIWRSIGQSIPHVEKQLAPFVAEGLELVRYSPAERTIDNFAGEHAMIRFYKDPDEWRGWTGDKIQAINFTQSLMERGDFTGYRVIENVFRGLPGKVFGPNNENLGELHGGLLSNEQMHETMRQSRVYLYHGTYPASYTLSFIEAMMTGIPVVAVGPQRGNGHMFPGQRSYEVPDIIESGVSGFISDDRAALRAEVERLLGDYGAAKAMSAFGRARAIELFGKKKIAAEWKEFLG